MRGLEGVLRAIILYVCLEQTMQSYELRAIKMPPCNSMHEGLQLSPKLFLLDSSAFLAIEPLVANKADKGGSAQHECGGFGHSGKGVACQRCDIGIA